MSLDTSVQNQIYKGAKGKESLYDFQIPQNWNKKLILFMHGYMGYKDWGCWDLVQSYFVDRDFGFLKYNASHNGGTVSNPIDFDDLESFSNNSYSNEIEDFEAILELVRSHFNEFPEIYLIGHSRGGAVALLQSKNEHVSKICSWAGVATVDRFPTGDDLEEWKNNGVRYGKNGRTMQSMPHSYDQYVDFITNKDRLDIEAYCRNSKVPTLIVHGDKDTSVNISEGKTLSEWLDTDLQVIYNTQHTFDSSQPWSEDSMPDALRKTCEITLNFFND